MCRPDARRTVAGGDIAAARRTLAEYLYSEPSFGLFDAMTEMGTLTEEHVHEVVAAKRGQALWVSGSLGRREMLPNSDLDLFVLHERGCRPRDVAISGLDKVDLGQLALDDAVDLLEATLVDANRLIDGRPLGASALGGAFSVAIGRANTPDRQLANLLAEHAYYRFFDFPLKRTSFGPNLKYSSGSARVTLFFNFVHRYLTGEFPAQRSGRPELEDALVTIEAELHCRAPHRSVELILLVKCAAISVFDMTGDPRAKYVSRWALTLIHEICYQRFAVWGLRRADDLVSAYAEARHEIEATIDDLIVHILRNHPCAEGFLAVTEAPIQHRAATGARLAAVTPMWRRALLTHAAWQLTTASPPARLVRALADELMERPAIDSWGGLMAVACSPTADDDTLRRLVTWLADNEPGAYLAKLVRRNPAASPLTRQLAHAGHMGREVLREMV
jgi:predicted nucleotidyltransferase